MSDDTPYLYVPDMRAKVSEAPQQSIVSQTFLSNDQLKAILFSFAQGQELSEHTAAVPAIIQIISGEAHLTLGKDKMEAKEGAWAYMPARLPHSLLAKTPVIMLLLMLSDDNA